MVSIQQQISDVIEQLSPEQQAKVLDFAKQFQRPKGVPAHTLLKHAGKISPEDLALMEEAIEDCERIDERDW
jgi:hypothetical protein